MRFCMDVEQSGWFYVDREIDDRADHFKPCKPCAESLSPFGQRGEIWFRADLCGECHTALDALGKIAEEMDERILILHPIRDPVLLSSDPALPEPCLPQYRVPHEQYPHGPLDRIP